MGRTHYGAWRKCRGAKVVAVCVTNPAHLAAKVRGNIRGAADNSALPKSIRIFDDYARLLETGGFDVVDLTVPTHLHAEMSIAALKAGYHVLCEKPMALGLKDCDRMLAAAKKAKRQLLIAQCVRFFTENRVFARANLTTMINYGATFAVSFFMSLYLQVIGALTPMEAGVVMIAMPVVQMLFSPIAGKLSDTIGGRVLMTAGLVVTGIGMAMFGFIGTAYNQTAIILNLAVIGFGIALFGAPNTNLVLGLVDRRDSGSANSILATMRHFWIS